MGFIHRGAWSATLTMFKHKESKPWPIGTRVRTGKFGKIGKM
jgi:hypothetical protein